MRRTRYILALIVLCFAEITLIQVEPLLESYDYPLVSSLTCIETEDSKDLYWNINQIEVVESVMGEEQSLTITLNNNIPGFDSYFFRLDSSEQWEKAARNDITVTYAGNEHQLQVKAVNDTGTMLPAVTYRIVHTDDTVRVVPDDHTIVKGKYDFRYENIQSPKVKWLQQYTLPVIYRFTGQWDMLISLREWVNEQIPNRNPLIESQWDAQRILQAVWRDETAGFICDAYAATYVSACVSVGLEARMLHLGDECGTGHYVTEVWSDDYLKWVLMDPLHNCYFTMHGIPLSALELHHLWKNNTWEGLKKQRDKNEHVPFDAPNSDYCLLFKDIQLINANDFLSRPLQVSLTS